MEREEELREGATILTCGQEKTYVIEISRGVLITAYQFLVKGEKKPTLCAADSLSYQRKTYGKRLWKKSKAKCLALEMQQWGREQADAVYSGIFTQRLESLWEMLRPNILGASRATVWWHSIICYVEFIRKLQGVPSGLKSLSLLNTVQKAVQVLPSCMLSERASKSSMLAAIKMLNKIKRNIMGYCNVKELQLWEQAVDERGKPPSLCFIIFWSVQR